MRIHWFRRSQFSVAGVILSNAWLKTWWRHFFWEKQAENKKCDGDEDPLISLFTFFCREPDPLGLWVKLKSRVRKQKMTRRWGSIDFVVHVFLPRTRSPKAFSEIKIYGPERSCETVPGIPHQGPRNLRTKTLSPWVPFAFWTKFAKLYDFPKVWTNELRKTQLE